MYVEVATVDADGWRGNIQSFENVSDFYHEREGPSNDWTARIHLTKQNEDEVEVVGDGYGLEIALAIEK